MIGLYLEPELANGIVKKKFSAIVKDKYMRKIVDTDMVLTTDVDGKKAGIGLVKLSAPKEIDKMLFLSSHSKHGLTDEQRKEWWPAARKYYFYSVSSVFPFKQPKCVADADVVSDLKDHSFAIESFDVRKLTSAQLGDYFRKACAWYAAVRNGGRIKFTKDELIRFGKKVSGEMLRRGFKFHEDKMKPASVEFIGLLGVTKEFYLKINRGTTSKRGEVIQLNEFMRKWDSMKLFEAGIMLVGSMANNGSTTGDIDIVIKADEDSDLYQLIKWRILRAYPEYEKRLHIIPYGKWYGPFTSHVELADIVALKPAKIQVKKMSEMKRPDVETQQLISMNENRIVPMRPFFMLKPMHGRHKEERYTIDTVLDIMNAQWS